MLVWSENELTAAAKLLGFTDIEDITKRYKLFGGILWYCFFDVVTKCQLPSEIAKLKVSDLPSVSAGDINLSHIIFHRYCDGCDIHCGSPESPAIARRAAVPTVFDTENNYPFLYILRVAGGGGERQPLPPFEIPIFNRVASPARLCHPPPDQKSKCVSEISDEKWGSNSTRKYTSMLLKKKLSLLNCSY